MEFLCCWCWGGEGMGNEPKYVKLISGSSFISMIFAAFLSLPKLTGDENCHSPRDETQSQQIKFVCSNTRYNKLKILIIIITLLFVSFNNLFHKLSNKFVRLFSRRRTQSSWFGGQGWYSSGFEPAGNLSIFNLLCSKSSAKVGKGGKWVKL